MGCTDSKCIGIGIPGQGTDCTKRLKVSLNKTKSMTQVGAKQLEDIQHKQDKDGVKVCSAEVTDSPLGKTFKILNRYRKCYHTKI